MVRVLGYCFAALSCARAFAAAPVPLNIATESAPAGGWAQIKIYAAKPMAIANGHLVLSLDPTAFGSGAAVGLFGANGDASGTATTNGSQIDIQFSSPSGGIGQLTGLPALVISAPVLPSATGSIAVTATSPDSSVTVASGSVQVKGTLSVANIPAGMGVVPAGTVVPISGTGFTSATTVTIDGVVIAATHYVSPTEIDIRLGGTAELAGKRARVVDNGAEFDYFCFQPNPPLNSSGSVQPLFPLLAGTGFTGYSSIMGAIAVENPHPSTARVSFSSVPNCCGPPSVAPVSTVTIPAGSWALFNGANDSTMALNSSLPIRVVALELCSLSTPQPACLAPANPYDSSARFGTTPPALTPSSLAFTWQQGSAAPASRAVVVTGDAAISSTVAQGAPWLSASVQTGSAPNNTLTISIHPSQLAVGTYQGSISVSQVFGPFSGPPAQVQVSLTVTASSPPVISATPASLTFTAPSSNAAPSAQTISVTSDSGPAAFSVSVPPGSWIKASPVTGTTPATITVTWDPAVTSQIYYQQRSTPSNIWIDGPANRTTVAATFNVTGVQTFQTYLGESGGGPNGLVFSAQTGSGAQSQTINVDPAGTISATVDQTWMTATATNTQIVSVTVNPAGLAPGTYSGNVTISESGIAPVAVPVTLGVWSAPPPLTISPSSFTFVGSGAPLQTAMVSSSVPYPLTILNGTSWLSVIDHYSAPSPTSLIVGLANPPQVPGEYDGSFTLSSAGGSAYAPVTLLVEPVPAAPPVVAQFVNAASNLAGGVSPGEIVSIRGYGVGASQIGGLKLDQSGKVATSLNGLEVTFDGVLAPLTYTSADQTNLVVPYEVWGKASTVMQVSYTAASGTLQTGAWTLPVVASVPGVFTLDGTGAGPAAVINQDGTVNSTGSPSPRGSVISIYATGEGQTSPAGVTGSVTQPNAPLPQLPVAVTIGGVTATVLYAGSAPGDVAGVLQVNAVVPPGIAPGPAVAVVVTVGGVSSQAGVTIRVD